MGETGCGKTSLITFMCKLMATRADAINLVLVKVKKFSSIVRWSLE